MFTRISRKKLYIRNLLAKFGLAKQLYEYNFSASCPKSIVSEWTEDGMIGRIDARDLIRDTLKAANINHVYVITDKIVTNIDTVDRHLSIYPDSQYGAELKAAKGLQKFTWKFGGLLLGYDYYLYFEDQNDLVTFQIMR